MKSRGDSAPTVSCELLLIKAMVHTSHVVAFPAHVCQVQHMPEHRRGNFLVFRQGEEAADDPVSGLEAATSINHSLVACPMAVSF